MDGCSGNVRGDSFTMSKILALKVKEILWRTWNHNLGPVGGPNSRNTPKGGLIKIPTKQMEMGQVLPFHWMPKSEKAFGFRGLCPLSQWSGALPSHPRNRFTYHASNVWSYEPSHFSLRSDGYASGGVKWSYKTYIHTEHVCILDKMWSQCSLISVNVTSNLHPRHNSQLRASCNGVKHGIINKFVHDIEIQWRYWRYYKMYQQHNHQ